MNSLNHSQNQSPPPPTIETIQPMTKPIVLELYQKNDEIFRIPTSSRQLHYFDVEAGVIKPINEISGFDEILNNKTRNQNDFTYTTVRFSNPTTYLNRDIRISFSSF